MQFELTKNSSSPLKIFIYKEESLNGGQLVANLAYSVEESMRDLAPQKKLFTFLGTIDAGEVVGKVKVETPTPVQTKEMKKSEFIFGLMYAADNFVDNPKDKKDLQRIIKKIKLI